MRSLIPDELDEELNSVQIDIAAKGIPVIILFEGGSGRVISRVINELDRNLEPMGVRYFHMNASKKSSAIFADILNATPGKGDIVLYDRSWYSLAVDKCNGDDRDLEEQIGSIRGFEEYLLNNGTFIIKIGFRMSNEDFRERVKEYSTQTIFNNTYLSINHIDRVKFRAIMPTIVKATDTKRAPWDIVDVRSVQNTVIDVTKVIVKRLRQCAKGGWEETPAAKIRKQYPNPRKGLDLDGDSDNYGERMDELSNELERLQILLAMSGRSLVLGFEGWDAAGKGGAIKHVCHALNPRGYYVARIKAPTAEDKAHTHLWRFARDLPDPGYITIFDRTWYGRMMVEPIEGFCSKEEYSRSADELNGFEHIVYGHGIIVLKFWIDIDKDEQLKRFNDRKNDPLKQWKLTDEDWRNREKWDTYDEYVDDMISSTNTPWAPWVAVPGNNKKAARLCVMESVVNILKKELE